MYSAHFRVKIKFAHHKKIRLSRQNGWRVRKFHSVKQIWKYVIKADCLHCKTRCYIPHHTKTDLRKYINAFRNYRTKLTNDQWNDNEILQLFLSTFSAPDLLYDFIGDGYKGNRSCVQPRTRISQTFGKSQQQLYTTSYRAQYGHGCGEWPSVPNTRFWLAQAGINRKSIGRMNEFDWN